MVHQEHKWKSSDGIDIYGQSWSPGGDAIAVVCIVHGMGEHSGRYDHLVYFLNANGIAAIAYDQRGHGKSGGKKGHTPSYDLLLDGIKDLQNQAAALFPQTPQFLYGHSMGGNLILNYAMRRKPEALGVIASSPWLKLAFDPPSIQIAVGKFVNNFWPSFTQTTGLEHDKISRDPAEVEKYMNDTLIHDYISSNFFLSVHDAGIWALENANTFSLPLLIYHGTNDELTAHDASKNFAERVKKVTFKSWQDAKHEMHNETNREEVFEYLFTWLKDQMAPKVVQQPA